MIFLKFCETFRFSKNAKSLGFSNVFTVLSQNIDKFIKSSKIAKFPSNFSKIINFKWCLKIVGNLSIFKKCQIFGFLQCKKEHPHSSRGHPHRGKLYNPLLAKQLPQRALMNKSFNKSTLSEDIGSQLSDFPVERILRNLSKHSKSLSRNGDNISSTTLNKWLYCIYVKILIVNEEWMNLEVGKKF